MIVNLKGQGPGAAHAVPRTSGGPSPARGTPAPFAVPGTKTSPNENAVFDANGDGAIENWGFLHGGDSYTTFSPPPTGTDPTRGRKAETPNATRHADTPVAKRRVHAAYQRDGSPVHAAGSDPRTTPAPASGTRAPAAQPGVAPALRSAG